MTPSSLRSVLSLLENATEGSRELDAKIARVVLAVPEHAGEGFDHDYGHCFDCGDNYISIPRYTSSLDAALSLGIASRKKAEVAMTDEPMCQCPTCGRMHHHLQAGTPPAALTAALPSGYVLVRRELVPFDGKAVVDELERRGVDFSAAEMHAEAAAYIAERFANLSNIAQTLEENYRAMLDKYRKAEDDIARLVAVAADAECRRDDVLLGKGVDRIVEMVMDARGYNYATDPMEYGQNAYDLTCQCREEVRHALEGK